MFNNKRLEKKGGLKMASVYPTHTDYDLKKIWVVDKLKEILIKDDPLRMLLRRDRKIAKLRLFKNKTLSETGKIVHIPRERVRQIEKNIIDCLFLLLNR